MLTGLLHIHSSFRYLVVVLILASIVGSIMGFASGNAFEKRHKLVALFALIFTHVQLTVGLILYFLGSKGLYALQNVESVMKDSTARFFAVEHMSMMIIATVLITIGYSKSKRQSEDKAKFKTIAIFYGIALVLIFIMIPWPFLKEFGRWI